VFLSEIRPLALAPSLLYLIANDAERRDTMTHRTGLVTALALVAVLGLTVPAVAQPARVYGYGEMQRLAYDNGYRRGLEDGQRDARDRRSFDARRDNDYRNGDWGYNRRYGPRGQYRQDFRNGYEAGYSAGYRGTTGAYGDQGRYGQGRAVPRPGYPGGAYPYPNDRYPGDSRYPQTPGYGGYGYGRSAAFDNGYNDGYEKGIEDARDRDRFDPTRHGWYKDGDRRYNSRYGSREQYKITYRDGFRQGYDAGYREASAYDYRNGRRDPRGGFRLPWPF
jgi:hypothetical protein